MPVKTLTLQHLRLSEHSCATTSKRMAKVTYSRPRGVNNMSNPIIDTTPKSVQLTPQEIDQILHALCVLHEITDLEYMHLANRMGHNVSGLHDDPDAKRAEVLDTAHQKEEQTEQLIKKLSSDESIYTLTEEYRPEETLKEYATPRDATGMPTPKSWCF